MLLVPMTNFCSIFQLVLQQGRHAASVLKLSDLKEGYEASSGAS